MACPRGCIVTLVAFVWLFSTVRFQMCSQTEYMRGCIVTLVAFIWPFSTVSFQMCPQISCMRRDKVALVAFVWFYYFIISVSQGNIYIKPTFTFMPSPDSYSGFYWEAVIHENGHYPVWIILCFLGYAEKANYLSQLLQENCFYVMIWMLMCFFRLLLTAKQLLQNEQVYV